MTFKMCAMELIESPKDKRQSIIDRYNNMEHFHGKLYTESERTINGTVTNLILKQGDEILKFPIERN